MDSGKRIIIIVDPADYERLRTIQRVYGFRSVRQLVAALIHVFLDYAGKKGERRRDLPEDDEWYIAGMFDELGHVQRMPDGDAPIRRHPKKPE